MQTIGERLEEARKKKGVSIREAAEATKIRGDYLQKFESNQFDIGLTEIYTRGFLRTYAAFLKIPSDRIMSDYAALGRGDIRPRQPSREVYGRMDITVASAGDASDRAAPPSPEPTAAPDAASSNKPQPHYPKGTGSSLPTGPDPAVVFKWVKIGGIVAGFVVLVFIIKAIFSGGSTPAPRTTTTTPAATPSVAPAAAAPAPAGANDHVITLVALDTVYVRVMNEATGEELYKGTLSRGQTQVVPWTATLDISASAGEYLALDIQGKRFPIKTYFTGFNHVKLPGPTK